MTENSTFRERVQDFWQWFPTVAPAIAGGLMSGNGLEGLAFDFAAEVRDRVGGLSWVFGPGEAEGRFSFTVTGEGQRAKQLLSHYWLSQAVEVPGWDFHCSRQPSSTADLSHVSIDVAGSSVNAETLMVATEVIDEDQAVNIKVWHEAFEDVPDDARFQILFLLLDEALGEYVTQSKLGSIQFSSDLNAKPLAELPGYLSELWTENGWEHASPLETYSGYRAEPAEGFDRSDSVAGYTCVPNVVLGFLNGKGSLDEDPIAATGAEYVFVQIKTAPDSHEDPLAYRAEIEDAIALQLDGSGYVIGGATGTHHLYIDLVIFDSDRSKSMVQVALQQKEISDTCQIKPFVTTAAQ